MLTFFSYESAKLAVAPPAKKTSSKFGPVSGVTVVSNPQSVTAFNYLLHA
jgi:hypothetical protein